MADSVKYIAISHSPLATCYLPSANQCIIPSRAGSTIGISAITLLAAARLTVPRHPLSHTVNFLTSIWVVLIIVKLPVLTVITYRTFCLINAKYLFTKML